jgi:hypothetical protein
MKQGSITTILLSNKMITRKVQQMQGLLLLLQHKKRRQDTCANIANNHTRTQAVCTAIKQNITQIGCGVSYFQIIAGSTLSTTYKEIKCSKC